MAELDFTASVRGMQQRTDTAGDPVTDYNGEEDRLADEIMSAGVIGLGDDSWKVRPGTGMNVLVGSGNAKTDLAVVRGTVSGQAPYRVRLDETEVEVAIDAADASLTRRDSIWLVVRDGTYDAGLLSLPRIGYRPGDPGASEAPGPDPAWTASLRLADVIVPNSATEITDDDIVDRRVESIITAPFLGHIQNKTRQGEGTTTVADAESLLIHLPTLMIPVWAQRFDIQFWVQASYAVIGEGNVGGVVRVRAESDSGPIITPQHNHMWLDASGAATRVPVIGGTVNVMVEDDWLGTNLPLRITAQRVNGNGRIRADTFSRAGYQAIFHPRMAEM